MDKERSIKRLVCLINNSCTFLFDSLHFAFPLHASKLLYASLRKVFKIKISVKGPSHLTYIPDFIKYMYAGIMPLKRRGCSNVYS